MEPRRSYPSDVSREQFERILPLLEGVRKRTKPRTVDLHEVFNAVLYLLKSGCQWRMLGMVEIHPLKYTKCRRHNGRH